MIARLWKGETPVAKGDAYTEYLEATGVRDCLATQGNRGVLLFRRNLGDRNEFLFLSLWDSREAIRRFAGEDIGRAHYYPDDEGYLLELTPTVEHYEVISWVEKDDADAE